MKNGFLKEIEGLIEETEAELQNHSAPASALAENSRGLRQPAAPDKTPSGQDAPVLDSVKASKGEKHPHGGHRVRMKKSFDTDPDFETFSDVQVLEYLLFNTVPRVDTNVLAHDLMDAFGSFSGVLNANTAELKAMKYIGEETARMLTSILPAARRAEESRLRNNAVLQNTAQAAAYLAPFFQNRGVEHVYLASLSNSGRVISVDRISVGDTDFSSVEIKKIIETACRHNAGKVILAHNHPSGSCVPSPEDREVTVRLTIALLSINVILADHLIFTANDFYSFFAGREFESVYKYADQIFSANLVKELRLKHDSYRAGVFPRSFDDEVNEQKECADEYSTGHPDPDRLRIKKER